MNRGVSPGQSPTKSKKCFQDHIYYGKFSSPKPSTTANTNRPSYTQQSEAKGSLL